MPLRFERDINRPAWRARPEKTKCYYYAGRISQDPDGPLNSKLWYAYRVYENDENPENWKAIGDGYKLLSQAKLACEWDFLKRFAKSLRRTS